MRIKLEIHVPGLDLHQERWNHHVLFMDRVHDHADRIAACSWKHYSEAGRGSLHVDHEQWMTVIKGDQWTEHQLFPCGYVTEDKTSLDIDPLGAGFREMISDYDPNSEMILLVEHHPGDQLSCYLVEPDIPPPEMLEHFQEG